MKTEVNQNFTDVEALVTTEATTRADEDGFTYFDETDITNTGTTETLKRTYTFNKSVDFVKLSAHLITSADSGMLKLYKNDVLLTTYSNIELLPSPVGFTLSTLGSGGEITTTNTTTTSTSVFVCLIKVSFSINDTLKIKLDNTGNNTTTSSWRLIEGYKNKSTDTTWVSVS